MAYIAPTPATFKARYPEFTPVSDTLTQLVLNESIADVGDTWYERDRARAQMLLAAHRLALEGEPARSIAIAGGGNGGSGSTTGAVKRRRVGDVETEFQGAGSSSGGAGGSSSGYAYYQRSTYGQQFWLLLQKNFPAIEAV